MMIARSQGRARPGVPKPPGRASIPAGEALAEIAEILAAGLIRLRTPKSSGISAPTGESSLHFTARPSGHADPKSKQEGA